jgi:hypothetical protein
LAAKKALEGGAENACAEFRSHYLLNQYRYDSENVSFLLNISWLYVWKNITPNIIINLAQK